MVSTDARHERHVVVRSPADPNVVVGEVDLMPPDEASLSVARARSQQTAWADDGPARAEALAAWASALEAHRDVMADLVVAEAGKPIREATAEVDRGIRILRYYSQAVFDEIGLTFAGAAGSRIDVERRPLGTFLVITPWNFPVAIPLWKIAPALAYGNAVLFRPSTSASLVARKLVDLAPPLLKAGVLQFLPTSARETGLLLDDVRIAGVSFTGSTEVGRGLVMRVVRRGGVAQAEMGGQNASLVLDDADLELAAATIAEAAMGYAGQKCTATSRIIIDRRVQRKFVGLLAAAVASTKVGDPTDPDTVVGPLISESARTSVARTVDEAVKRGATSLDAGRAVPKLGWYYPPTLLRNVAAGDPVAVEETFGPVATLHVVDSVDEAVKLANMTIYGLSGAVFGEDRTRARAVAGRLAVGIVRVNASTAGVDFHVPFGGYGASSYGPREQGRAAKEFFTTTRTILVR